MPSINSYKVKATNQIFSYFSITNSLGITSSVAGLRLSLDV
jgi:hypothetical protein